MVTPNFFPKTSSSQSWYFLGYIHLLEQVYFRLIFLTVYQFTPADTEVHLPFYYPLWIRELSTMEKICYPSWPGLVLIMMKHQVFNVLFTSILIFPKSYLQQPPYSSLLLKQGSFNTQQLPCYLSRRIILEQLEIQLQSQIVFWKQFSFLQG